MVDINTLQIGQAVYLLKDVGDDPDGDSPGGCWGRYGEEVFVRQIFINNTNNYPIQVSHENVLDKSFGVNPEEIRA